MKLNVDEIDNLMNKNPNCPQDFWVIVQAVIFVILNLRQNKGNQRAQLALDVFAYNVKNTSVLTRQQ